MLYRHYVRIIKSWGDFDYSSSVIDICEQIYLNSFRMAILKLLYKLEFACPNIKNIVEV